MRYSLRQLEVFVAIARAESVSAAAEELAMSQSAASSALAEIERQFDVRLFDRIGKRLRLSELGRSLRPRAEAVLDQARELEDHLASDAEGGHLRVGATLTIGHYLAVPLMARFLRERPGVRVGLDIANTAEIVRRVANFEADVGLIEGEVSAPDLTVEPFRDDELVVFSAPSHAPSRKRSLRDEDLRAVDWIVREPGSGTRQTFERALAGLVPDLRLTLELRDIEVIKRAVEAGLGMGCVSRIALSEELARRTLVLRPVPHRDFRRRFSFVLHRQKHVGPALQHWIDLCRRGDG